MRPYQMGRWCRLLERPTADSGCVSRSRCWGAGTPLFDGVGRRRLTQIPVEVSPVCTHLTYRVASG